MERIPFLQIQRNRSFGFTTSTIIPPNNRLIPFKGSNPKNWVQNTFQENPTNLYDLSCYQNQNVLPKHTKNLVQKQRKIPKRNQRNLLDKSVSARSWNVNPTKLWALKEHKEDFMKNAKFRLINLSNNEVGLEKKSCLSIDKMCISFSKISHCWILSINYKITKIY